MDHLDLMGILRKTAKVNDGDNAQVDEYQAATLTMKPENSLRLFDLNIEEVLENWEVSYAIREIISNALDEQFLTKTDEVQIFKDGAGLWHIRDYGRGLEIDHFTLNENKEKLAATSGVIGKFGVGLKDALATFHRHGVKVTIRSSKGQFTVIESKKHNFDNITTLHIGYEENLNTIIGTEFILEGLLDSDIQKAKSYFLKFSNEEVLEVTAYGEVLSKPGQAARVYINGVFANEESNFLFSYNITNLTDAMRKKLNRERINVGRSTYTERVKMILKNTKSKAIKEKLADQIYAKAEGNEADELQWIEIRQMALNILHDREEVVLLTEEEALNYPSILDTIKSDGYKVVLVSENEKHKIDEQMDQGGPSLRTLENYVEEYNDSFQYKFVEPYQLTPHEQSVYKLTENIISLLGLDISGIPKIRISETMRVTIDDTEGCWDPQINSIVIKRSKLLNLQDYAGTLLHEIAHALTNTDDATRDFENVLTLYLGKIAVAAIR